MYHSDEDRPLRLVKGRARRDPGNLWNLPSNVETERALLGGLLTDPTQHALVVSIVCPDDFHRPQHRNLWAHLCELAAKSRASEPYNMTVVFDDAFDKTEQWGGAAYVIGMPNACPSVESIELLARQIADMGRRRRLILAVAHAGIALSHGDDPAATVSTLQKAINGVSAEEAGSVHVLDVLRDEVAAVESRVIRRREAERNGSGGSFVDGASMGIGGLDQLTGGLRRGDMLVLAARPAMGKTAFALGCALEVAGLRNGNPKPVLIVSLEMSRGQLADRFACYHSRVSTLGTRSGDLTDRQLDAYNASAELVSGLPIHILDGCPPLRRVRAEAIRLRDQYDGLGLIVVDYLQLMTSETRVQNREQEVAQNARGMKLLAGEVGCPVMLLSQLNRNLESRANKRPMMSDLRESGAIEQDADQILALYREHVYNEEANPESAEAILLKNRHGTLGTVRLGFQLGRFVEGGV